MGKSVEIRVGHIKPEPDYADLVCDGDIEERCGGRRLVCRGIRRRSGDRPVAL